MSYPHAIVWIDHRHANVERFSPDTDAEEVIVRSGQEGRLHRKSGVPGSGRQATDRHYFDEVRAAVADVDRVLLVGPGTTKTELMTHLRDRHPADAERVVAVEAMPQATRGELLAHARRAFRRLDQLQ